jgi:hypothetical protein
MMDRQAKDDLRAATVPPTPNDYKLELSPDAKLPGGVEYKFNASDPSLAALKNWAHAKGFDQSTLSEMLTIYATHEAQHNAALAEVCLRARRYPSDADRQAARDAGRCLSPAGRGGSRHQDRAVRDWRMKLRPSAPVTTETGR